MSQSFFTLSNPYDAPCQIRICVTQPRRVAASAMARRVAFERSASVGDEVGYAVRFDDRSSSMTRIKYVTDGVALREILETGGFENYNVFCQFIELIYQNYEINSL